MMMMDAQYAKKLSSMTYQKLEPLVAKPYSPENVAPASEISSGIELRQILYWFMYRCKIRRSRSGC